MDRVGDDAIGHLLEVGGERRAELLEFGPEGVVHELLGDFDHDRSSPLSAIAKWLEVVSSQERDEEFARPRVRESEAKLDEWGGPLGRLKPSLDASASFGGGDALAICRRSREEGFDPGKSLS